MHRRPLAACLLHHLDEPARARVDDPDTLEHALKKAVESARLAWPDVEQPSERFLAHLSGRLPLDVDPVQAVGRLHTDDLFLASACLDGHSRAITAFDKRCFSLVDGALRRMGLQPAVIEEVKQQLREQLLVGHGRGSAPLLTGYSGAGQLRNWLRVVAVRTATAMVGRLAREAPTEHARLERAVGQVRDPELEYFKTLYRAEFKTAFGQALQQLESRQRTLLRQHLIDGLSIQELSALYHVHKATTARWLQRVRETLLERTRDALREQLGISPTECQSIMGLIESRLEITLQTYLEGE